MSVRVCLCVYMCILCVCVCVCVCVCEKFNVSLQLWGQYYLLHCSLLLQNRFEMRGEEARSKAVLEFQKEIAKETSCSTDESQLLSSRLPIFSPDKALTPTIASASSV